MTSLLERTRAADAGLASTKYFLERSERRQGEIWRQEVKGLSYKMGSDPPLQIQGKKDTLLLFIS